MKRREILASAGLALTSVSGCLGNTPGTTGGGENSTVDPQVSQQFVSCEEHYIRTEVINDNEEIDGSIDPTVVELDTRDTGVCAEIRTTFATLRSAEDAPDEYVDYAVTAYYFRSENETLRTEDADRDPKNGSQIQCG